MNLQTQSNVYLVIIPRNYSNDIHICGKCRAQYTSLGLFLKHKETCRKSHLKEVDQDHINKKMEIDNLIEVGSLDSVNDTVVKDSNQINVLNTLLLKNPNQFRQNKIDFFEGQELCMSQKDIILSNNNSNNNNDDNDNNSSNLNDNNNINSSRSSSNSSSNNNSNSNNNNNNNNSSSSSSNTFVQQKTQLIGYCKRSLQNDEEVIATLLANQLNSETSIGKDNLNTEVNVHSFESFPDIQLNKEKKEKDENKVMYRGKMRKLFSCQIEGCLYKTLLRKDIERHSRVHTGERPFKCFLCGKAFNRTDKLLLHQRIHAGDKRYKCTKCDYASVDSGSLIKHLRVHNGERPFKCQLCSYRARDSSQLTVHLRTHTGDSPFVCTNNKCKAAFKTNSDLKRHMVVHSEEKPHSCTYCPYKSTLKRNLQIHIQSQHPNGELKEYKCHLCPTLVLPTSRKLKNHVKKHHGKTAEKFNSDKTSSNENHAGEEENLVEKQENFKKRKRKTRRNSEKIAVGVMSKAYDCKLCEASFVCQDSLLTHQRYHNKIEDELRKSECNRNGSEIMESTKYKKMEDEIDKKVESFSGELGLSDGCVVDTSFSDSLRNAEILASLNSSQGIGNIRQYVMIAPDALQNVYNPEEYILVQN